MKKLPVKSIELRKILAGITEWLTKLGYSKSTIYNTPNQLRELFHYLENDNNQLHHITQEIINEFITYLAKRPNHRRAGGISIAHINKHIDAIKKLLKYLRIVEKIKLEVSINYLQKEESIMLPEVLTKEEIKQLYKATDNTLLGLRDRAMLGIYYGCGLRKSEGLNLEIKDVLFERKLLFIKNAKNHHQRYVPISERVIQDLENYIYNARELLLSENSTEEKLFISQRGNPVASETFTHSLKRIKSKTNLKDKKFGLHSLRHSIATHLLQVEMPLENIALFLGHKTLDSTQIYTHIINGISTD